MREVLVLGLPWLLSIVGIISMVLLGNKVQWAWIFTACVTLVWAVWAILLPSLGLLPLLAVQLILCARNHRRWRQEAPTTDQS